MKTRLHTPVRPILVGGAAAMLLSLLAAFLANDLGHWWWHAGTIGAAVGITVLISFVPQSHLHIVRRIFLLVALSFVIAVGVIYTARITGGLGKNPWAVALGNRNSVAAGVAMAGFASVLLFRRRGLLLSLITISSLLLMNSRASLVAFIIGVIAIGAMAIVKQGIRWWHVLIGVFAVLGIGAVFFSHPLINEMITTYDANHKNHLRALTEKRADSWEFAEGAETDVTFFTDEQHGNAATLRVRLEADHAGALPLIRQAFTDDTDNLPIAARVFVRSASELLLTLQSGASSVECVATTEWTACETPLASGNASTFALIYNGTESDITLDIASPELHLVPYPEQYAGACQAQCIEALRTYNKLITRLEITAWDTDRNVTSRLHTQTFTFERFLQHPVAGYGIDTFAADYREHHPNTSRIFHPHSGILQVLYERGILGLVALVLLFAGIIVAVHPPRDTIVPLLVFMFFLQLADSTFYLNYVYYPFWVSLSLLRGGGPAGSAELAGRAAIDRVSTRFIGVLDVLIVLSGVAVAYRALLPARPGTETFVLILAGSSALAWLFFKFRAPAEVLTTARRNLDLLLLPFVSAGIALIVSALARTYYSLGATMLFVLTVLIGTIMVRLVFRNMYPAARVLLVGDSQHFAHFVHDGDFEHYPWTTNARGNDYQYVVIGEHIPDEQAFRNWVKQQQHPRYTAYSAEKALEIFYSRIPAESVTPEWVAHTKTGVQAYLPFKRVLESALIIIFSPIILLVALLTALLVLVSLGRPVIFSQQRVGLNNKPFTIYKFRTMRGTRTDAAFADEETERITPVGRMLRGFRLDEVPQFWNVLKGDMSIIGPRPEQVEFAEQFEHELPAYAARHVVRPGITGWAQVNQGYAAGADETLDKLRYDFFYIKHFSPWLDIVIVGRTVLTILTKFGAK